MTENIFFFNKIIIFKMDNRHKITYILSRLSIIEETESGNFSDGVKSKCNFPKITRMSLILKEMQCCIYNRMKYSNVTQ